MPSTFAIAAPIGAYHPLLRDCLQSLVAQDPRPVISVLDASGDKRTAAAIDEFGRAIAYRRAGPDAGQTAAILEGWEKAPGDILGWLNADDALYPGAMAQAAAHFSDNPDTDVLYGHSVIINDDGAITGYHWAVEPPSAAILSGCIISQPSCFFRRTAYEKAGGLDAALHYTMDWDLWTRLWKAGATFRFADSVLSRVLWSREAKTGGYGPRRRRELNRIIDANNPPLRRLKSRAGFALHHLLEYAAPQGLAGAARRIRAVRSINGLGRNGEIGEAAEIPLVHYGREPARSILVAADVEKGRLTASTGDDEIELSGDGRAALKIALHSGETAAVRFRTSAGASARLRSLRIA